MSEAEKNSRISMDDFDKKMAIPEFKTFYPYYEIENSAACAMSLMHFGMDTALDSKLMHNLPFLKEYVARTPRTLNESELQNMLSIVREGTIDAVRICICFENYMKAVLLMKGYMIHSINNTDKAIGHLSKKQKKVPVEYKELRLLIDWKFIKDKIAILEGVKHQTLQMSLLLSEGYQKIINIPTEVHTFIKEQNEKRNPSAIRSKTSESCQ